jgi:predicted MFS family arabinose efflux permease
MFYQLYDLLPNFIEDWVDSSSVYRAFFVPLFAVFGSTPPAGWKGNVPQEMMINLNAGMIMLLVSGVGYVAGRLRSMQNMILGIIVSAVGILMLNTRDGWVLLLGIAVFSIGEMFASPTKMRYVADMATPDKKALYLGYVNATVGIGWTIGSWIAGGIYEETGDKVALGRRYLVDEVGLSAEAVSAIPKTEVLPRLESELHLNAAGISDVLWSWQDQSPATVWWTFAMIGLVSMVGMIIFDQITRRQHPHEEWLLIGLVGVVTLACYGPAYSLVFPALMLVRKAAEVALGPVSAQDAWRPGTVAVGVLGVGWMVWRLLGFGG